MVSIKFLLVPVAFLILSIFILYVDNKLYKKGIEDKKKKESKKKKAKPNVKEFKWPENVPYIDF